MMSEALVWGRNPTWAVLGNGLRANENLIIFLHHLLSIIQYRYKLQYKDSDNNRTDAPNPVYLMLYICS